MAKKLRSKKSLLKHVLYVVLVPLELCVLRDIVSRTFLSLYDLLPFFRGSRVSSLCSRWSRALGASRPTCSHTLLAPCPAYSYFWYSVYHRAAFGEFFCLLNTFHHLVFHICTSTCIMFPFWASARGKFRYQGKFTCHLERIV